MTKPIPYAKHQQILAGLGRQIRQLTDELVQMTVNRSQVAQALVLVGRKLDDTNARILRVRERARLVDKVDSAWLLSELNIMEGGDGVSADATETPSSVSVS
jgi:hypothetical protein